MNFRFRECTLDQPMLLSPSMQEWLPENHLARFIGDVTEQLDLSKILREYERRDGRGQAGYHPLMLTRLLLYGYAVGDASSRVIERKTYEDVAFRYLAADQHPDHDTIAAFRQRHLQTLAGLFIQALQLCRKAGLVKLGHVAIDGSKLQANASKHKAMSYGRMLETEQKLQAEVEELLRRAQETDAQEDQQYGKGKRGDELPEELARRESRLQKIRQAKAELEAEAREEAEQNKAAAETKIAERRAQAESTGRKPGGRDPQAPDPEKAVPEEKAQKNFTDAESRIMPDGGRKGSFVQGYNTQIAVDSAAQIIVAAAVTQETNDKRQLVPMLKQIAQNLGTKPAAVSADAGYFSQEQVTDEQTKDIGLYVATGKQKHGEPASGESIAAVPAADENSALEQMKQKLKTEAGHAMYKMRKAIVEPVFGQIKEWRRFRRFGLRGLDKVSAEWNLICLTHNLRKLFRSGWNPRMA
ncbi:MAG TPA: IS1182 family transposase [Terracidiphilus sp.]|jgi:transposase